MDDHGFSRILFNSTTVTSRTLTDIHGGSPTFTDAHELPRTIFHFPMNTLRNLMDSHGQILILSRTPHGLSWTLRDNFRFPQRHLTDAYELPRTNFDFLTDTSQTLTDSHVQFLIFSRAPQVRSRTFTDNFQFAQGHLTDAHGLSRTIFDFFTVTSRTLTDSHGQVFIFSWTPHGCSRTFKDIFLFPHGHLKNAHGLSRTIFNSPKETSQTLTDFHGQFLISPRTPHGHSQTLTDNF